MTCTHDSSSGLDDLALDDPSKMWLCHMCNQAWRRDRPTMRGLCREAAAALVVVDSSLRLVSGWYDCPVWGREQHWWAERADGVIVDPTSAQFPSVGIGEYIEYAGILVCEECGTKVAEAAAVLPGNGMAFCDQRCYGRCIGML